MYDSNLYIYDGSFEGFLTVVFDAWPMDCAFVNIVSGKEFTPVLLENEIIVMTDYIKASRVMKWVNEKLPIGMAERIYDYFYSFGDYRENRMFKYLKACHRLGKWVDSFTTDEAVSGFTKAERLFNNESIIFDLRHKYLICKEVVI